jgi:mannose-6-phosphate isomerase-like protein (cupin superfamily)
MREASTEISTFKYVRPAQINAKKILWLAKTDRLFSTMQVLQGGGGETNLHSHPNLDGFWFVISGKARFYSDETTVAGELGPMEGILIPRGCKYWFEAVGTETLELLQVECSTKSFDTQQAMADRIDHTERKAGFGRAISDT